MNEQNDQRKKKEKREKVLKIRKNSEKAFFKKQTFNFNAFVFQITVVHQPIN